MPVFHQMGHHSNNLVDLPEMSAFAGAVFSPINCTESEVADQVNDVRKSRETFQTILDPQLYVPATERGKLKEWAYFPKDVDTADLTSTAWWNAMNERLAKAARKVGVDGICSPVVIPKVFDDKYYARIVGAASDLGKRVEGLGMRVLQTLLANFPDLAGDNRAMEIASIVSATASDWIYLVFVGTVEPRRELRDVDELKGDAIDPRT